MAVHLDGQTQARAQMGVNVLCPRHYTVAMQQNSVRWACLYSLAPNRNEVPFSIATGNWERMQLLI